LDSNQQTHRLLCSHYVFLKKEKNQNKLQAKKIKEEWKNFQGKTITTMRVQCVYSVIEKWVWQCPKRATPTKF